MLADGTLLGPYRIVAALGAGGMGEVYRAVDTRLGREVAVKVLPPEVSENPQRMARFEQEARAAGMLNHPNLLTIFDVGRAGDTPYLVFELLEGETLRGKIGRLSHRKAIEFALQVCRGLAAAQQRGIVHRDLKPDNLFVTTDERLKILDFGLVKVAETADQNGSTAEFVTALETGPGTILGTASYMSPEQVRGASVDGRSDIFALGAILYEMLSGRRAFSREFPVETMNAILHDDPPDLIAVDPSIRPSVARVVRHCLEKNPDNRFQSARDLAFQLESLLDETGSASASSPALPRKKRGRRLLIPGALALTLLAGAGAGHLLTVRSPVDPPLLRYLSDSGTDHSPAASPDGQTIAFASSRDGTSRIWVKQLRIGNEIALTSGSDNSPRFSADGSMILFTRSEGRDSSLYRVAAVGGEPQKIIDHAEEGDWSPDGQQITFVRFVREGSEPVSQIWVSAADGANARKIYATTQRILSWPRWSPDGMTIAATAGGRQTPGSIVLVDVGSGKARSLAPGGSAGVFTSVAWAGPRTLVYAYSDALTAARSAPGAVVVQDIETSACRKVLSLPKTGLVIDISGDGQIVLDINSSYQNLRELPLANGSEAIRPRWLTRGTTTDRQPVYSPDGEWVLFSSNRNGNLDLWKVSLRNGTLRRVTDHAAEDWDPAFTPDGASMLWSSNRSGHFEIWMASSDGSNPRQVSSDGVDAENGTATPDGKWVIYTSLNPAKRGLWKAHPDGTGATQIVRGPALQPEVSPDGQFVVYHYTAPQQGVVVEVVRVVDGVKTAFRHVLPQGMSAGRARWLAGGRTVAFVGADEGRLNGVFVQDFDASRDTADTFRKFAGFDPELPVESFGISPDGGRITLSQVQQLSGLMAAENVPDVRRWRR